LRSRGILFESFDSKARVAERTCFSSGTSSTWNAKFHTFRHKWQFVKLNHTLALSSENLTTFLKTPWNTDICTQFHAAGYFLESWISAVCQEIQWFWETKGPVENSQNFKLGFTLKSVNFCTMHCNTVLSSILNFQLLSSFQTLWTKSGTYFMSSMHATFHTNSNLLTLIMSCHVTETKEQFNIFYICYST
jgi:hypothetical protein